MSRFRNLSSSEIHSLRSAANAGIWYSHIEAFRLAAEFGPGFAPKPREEDFVATLVTRGLSHIARHWPAVLAPHGISLSLTGLFCHGRPQVSFEFGSRRASVELGDLLICQTHTDGLGAITARAILIQAKMASHPRKQLNAQDAQLELYTRWPAFRFTDQDLEPTSDRVFERAEGTTYVLIRREHGYPEDNSWPDLCTWGTAAAGRTLDVHESFAATLVGMLLGRRGRPFGVQRPERDWARTIRDLLRVTGSQTFRRTNIGYDDTVRRSDAPVVGYPMGLSILSSHVDHAAESRRRALGLHSVVQRVAPGDGDDDPPPEERTAPERPAGISVLLIETFDTPGPSEEWPRRQEDRE